MVGLFNNKRNESLELCLGELQKGFGKLGPYHAFLDEYAEACDFLLERTRLGIFTPLTYKELEMGRGLASLLYGDYSQYSRRNSFAGRLKGIYEAAKRIVW